MANPQALWSAQVMLNTDKCVHCGKCERECPLYCVVMVGNKPLLTKDNCIKCGHCIGVCPTGCYSMNDVPVESLPTIKPELKCSPEQVPLRFSSSLCLILVFRWSS
eukprot:TRINITY_DN2618_c0_g1_i3.p2 TRINITY_DN2618_c0_g1~~TRINITY_DN2618_c0_g1_i3.p2  ORF type:complete len:106 (+),score=28.53 TRINITY_DN2618_c0_g1_i3:65-382(+)